MGQQEALGKQNYRLTNTSIKPLKRALTSDNLANAEHTLNTGGGAAQTRHRCGKTGGSNQDNWDINRYKTEKRQKQGGDRVPA